MTDTAVGEEMSPSQRIDARIAELDDWRGATLARLRALVREADPDIVEEWKWRGVPVWSHGGIVCTGETYRQVVKMTFARGALLPIPRTCSTPASTAIAAAPLTCARERKSTRMRSRPWSGAPLPSTARSAAEERAARPIPVRPA